MGDGNGTRYGGFKATRTRRLLRTVVHSSVGRINSWMDGSLKKWGVVSLLPPPLGQFGPADSVQVVSKHDASSS